MLLSLWWKCDFSVYYFLNIKMIKLPKLNEKKKNNTYFKIEMWHRDVIKKQKLTFKCKKKKILL